MGKWLAVEHDAGVAEPLGAAAVWVRAAMAGLRRLGEARNLCIWDGTSDLGAHERGVEDSVQERLERL